ncbi:hypothetical protein EON80_24660 [bacterium]|nr:MAG: hypothetical protein EON80_24660 [bacterium]
MSQKFCKWERDSFPPSNIQVRVLCEDHSGPYALPFNCFYRDGEWIGVGAGKPIEIEVIGWKLPPPPAIKRDR